MIGRLIRLGILGAVGTVMADRWLASRGARERLREPRPIETVIVVDAPIEAVWDVLADVPGQPRWMTEMKSVRILTPGPVAVGTRAEATIRVLGMRVTDEVTVSAFEPPRRFAIRHEGAFAGSGEMTLEPGADGTTTIVRWSESIVAPVLPWLWAEVNRPVFGDIFQRDLERLRDLAEEAAGARGASANEASAIASPAAADAVLVD
jgi:uncharacterized membrane protein